MEILAFKSCMQQLVENFFEKRFSSIGIPFSPKDRHTDIADVEKFYMKNGCFWCLFINDIFIGTIAVRIINPNDKVIELKRMFVLPEYQGNGFGRVLLEHAITYAREQQYKKICLDTIKSFSVAQHLYRSMGVKETEKYNNNERAELYYELVL